MLKGSSGIKSAAAEIIGAQLTETHYSPNRAATQLSRLPRHLLCSICNALHVCTELLSRLSRHLFCSTSNALLLSTELLSRLSRSLLSSACIALCVGTELLSRLPRHHPCSISNALLVSTELLSRCEDTFSIQSASLFLYVLSSSQGPIFLLCYLCNDPLNCSQGLQETFSALCIDSASINTDDDMSFTSLQRRHLFIVQSKGFTREGFNERSSSSFIQSDTVPETNRYAPPTS